MVTTTNEAETKHNTYIKGGGSQSSVVVPSSSTTNNRCFRDVTGTPLPCHPHSPLKH